MSKILVVDDERTVVAAFQQILTDRGHEVATASRGDETLECVERDPPELVVMDVCMPGMNGLEALRRIKSLHPQLPVIIMTGRGTMETAIEATKTGAFDYHLKPLDPAEILRTIERALESYRLARQPVVFDADVLSSAADAMIGQGPAMQEVYKAIGRVAHTDATVLVRGESGTGKELAARAIYQHSSRSQAPLMIVNCAAIPETLLESELFGHEQGAFTGAQSRRIGKFQQAHGGTIFLDEIGDIPLSIQAKILRVLQEKNFERLGSNDTIRVDVRVIAATNRDLERAIASGEFREDLYHRLNVVTIRLPPLRQRREDIPRLAEYFLTKLAEDLKVAKPVVSEDAMDLLRNYPWPGNVREFSHTLQRAMIFTHGYPIQAADLSTVLQQHPEEIRQADTLREEDALCMLVARYLASRGGEGAHERLLAMVEKALLSEALRKTQGNQTHAARLLGLARPTLHAKMQKYGLRGDGGS